MASQLALQPTLAHLLSGLPPECLPEGAAEHWADIPICKLTLDSRRVDAGDAFLAVPGAHSDGRQFIDRALERGAAAVIAEADELSTEDARVIPVANLRGNLPKLARHFYADPSAHMALIAVTGTNGKTSVVDFIAQILRTLGVATGAIGTLGARLDNTVTEAKNTTPDVIALNHQLAQWSRQGVDHVAMEASSHALDQGRLAGLSLHTAVFTNLSRDHLDYHETEQAYAEAKLSLFRDFALKRAIFNADDGIARQVRAVATCPSIGISLENTEADVFVQIQSVGPLVMRLHGPLGVYRVETRLSGTFNAFNLAAAMMAVATLGYSFDDVVAAASRVEPVAGRMQVLASENSSDGISKPRVIIDYAHTPDALSRALAALRAETKGDLWVVFGCGGDRDRGKRALMGSAAHTYADKVIVTSDNPRSEDPDAIVDEIITGVGGAAERIVDRREAIEYAIQKAGEHDTVVIAGKGHEDYQEVAGVRQPFSDVDVALNALAQSAGGLQ